MVAVVGEGVELRFLLGEVVLGSTHCRARAWFHCQCCLLYIPIFVDEYNVAIGGGDSSVPGELDAHSAWGDADPDVQCHGRSVLNIAKMAVKKKTQTKK